MSLLNTVSPVWTQGMFLEPEHFQQQARYYREMHKRLLSLHPFAYGFSNLILNQEHLALGKLSIVECAGFFSDGYPFKETDFFSMPFMQVTEQHFGQVIYLAVPIEESTGIEVSVDKESMARFTATEIQVKNNTDKNMASTAIQVAQLSVRFLTDSEDRSRFVCLPIAKIAGKSSSGAIILEAKFVPTCVDINISPVLKGFLQEWMGQVSYRVQELSVRVTRPGSTGSAAMTDFLLLALLNRYEAFMKHLLTVAPLHPEMLFALMLQIAGELSTFTSAKKSLIEGFSYQHDNLATSFAPLIENLRQALSMVLHQTALPLTLQATKQSGIRACLIKDKQLLKDSVFVLAVKSDIPAEQLRSRFSSQIKIGPIEKIRELINIQMPGIELEPLSVAPQQIPYHAGFTYFQLNSNSQFWKYLEDSSGFAFHISGDFPGLSLEFWAIKKEG
jgi:type VI secretion system protein ImpJ